MLQIPELLAPAGDLERLRYAINYGADAVYCSLPEFGMRSHKNILCHIHRYKTIPEYTDILFCHVLLIFR